MNEDRLTLGRWLRAHLVVVACFAAIGFAAFTVVAWRLDNEFAATAWREHKATAVWLHVRLLVPYALIWLLHGFLSYPVARRRAAAKPRRLVLSALWWNLALFALSLGPTSYGGTGSLDSLARISMQIAPSLDPYVFIDWHLREVFTAIVVLLVVVAIWDFGSWLSRRLSGRPPIVRRGALVACGMILGAPVGFVWLDSRIPPLKSTERPNVLIIASDSLRYDHLSCHGYPRPTSPRIDELAANGIDLTRCYVATASTLESWATFMTGKYPANHGLRYMFIGREQAERIKEDRQTLPRILARQGYRSAVVGDWAANCFSLVDFGFDRTLTSDVQNLDVFLAEVALRTHVLVPHYFSNLLGESLVPHMRQATGYMNPARLTRRLLRELDAAAAEGNPFFGVLFLSSTHLPFQCGYPYNRMFADPNYRGPNRFALSFDVDDFIQHGFTEEHSAEERQHVIDLYDGGVRQFDDHVGRVIDHLRATGLDRNTIVIVTSDHGEDLYDPGTTLGHGTNFNGGDQSTRIPMIISYPGSERRALDVVSRSVDFLPTLLDMLDIDDVSPDVDGTTLVPAIADPTADPELAAYAETCYLFYPKRVEGDEAFAMEPADRTLYIDRDFDDQFVLKPKYHDYVIETKDRMMRTRRWKLIYIKGKNGPIYRFYDMDADPHQEVDLSSSDSPVMERMRRNLNHWMETGRELPWRNDWDRP